MGALEGLNPAQREAVTTTRGPLLIVAGPGSGKTRVIVHRIAYLVEHEGVAPYHILAVTFTNKAAREMRERLEGLLGHAGHGLTVGTFHWACARILRRDGQAVGIDPHFVIYDDGDQVSLMKKVLQAESLDEKRVAPRAVLSAISRAKSEMRDPDAYSRHAEGHWPEMVALLYRRYQEQLQLNHALDFDDLLLGVVDLFKGDHTVLEQYQERYQYLLVDEFQDTNVAQYEIVRLLGMKHRNVCAVGDVDQAIYSWRAADPRNVFHFQRDFPEHKIVLLEQNYRSTQAILDVADAVIRLAPGRHEKRLWTENERGHPAMLHEAYNEGDEAQFVVREIEHLVRDQEAHLRDCAVLYRTNAQSRALEEALIRYNTPYQLVGGTRFYERKEIKDLLAYLRLVLNPYDSASLLRVINVPPRKLGQKSLQELERWAARQGISLWDALQRTARGEDDAPGVPPNPLATAARRACTHFVELIEELQAEREGLTVLELLDLLLDRSGYARFLAENEEDGEERLENVQELRHKAAEYEDVNPAVALGTFLEEVTLVQDVDSLEAGGDAVTLMTLHTAKGLEFPYVFIVGLEEGLCPHSRSLDDRAAMEEERRLFFVGVTRAMRGLYLSYAFSRRFYNNVNYNTPSRFLADIPPELLTGARPGTPAITVAPGVGPAPASSRPPASARFTTPSPGHPTVPASGRPYEPPPPARNLPTPAALLDGAGAAGGRPAAGDGRSTSRPPAHDPASAPGAAAASAAPRFKAGDRVRHAHFGDGIVVSSQVTRGDEEVTVAFEGQGAPKKLSLAYAKLDLR
ncbi:MAG TPA: UvrD-helicase domain-containing protein [Chloroflexota bacterium]